MKLNKGDLIKCSSDDEAIRIIRNLSRANIEWDFCYEHEGVEGLWIEIQ